MKLTEFSFNSPLSRISFKRFVIAGLCIPNRLTIRCCDSQTLLFFRRTSDHILSSSTRYMMIPLLLLSISPITLHRYNIFAVSCLLWRYSYLWPAKPTIGFRTWTELGSYNDYLLAVERLYMSCPTFIFGLWCLYYWMKMPASLVIHGRSKCYSWPWRASVMIMVRTDYGREQLAILVAKIDYSREINEVSLLFLGIRAACPLYRSNKKGKSFLYPVWWRDVVCRL